MHTSIGYGADMGHRHWFKLPFQAPDLPVPHGLLPSGRLMSSVEDMAHYLIAHLYGGCYAEMQIFSTEGIAVLHRREVEFSMGGVSARRYGMGWLVIERLRPGNGRL
jgi:hypothetical protein